ncbi:MAG: MCE family protein [Nitrospirae bacterium]|nr:MAG: MCE family protein [Nitrospirota bacterium]
MNRQSQLHWAQVKVGMLVLVALAILIGVIMNLEEGMGLFARQVKFRATVVHTQGLKVGGPVRMNGVDIGNVHRIAIAQDSPNVDILFTVQKAVAPHIHRDAKISIRPMGLLGDKFLEIMPGSQTEPALAPGSVLVGEAESDLTNLASGASATLDNVNAALREMQKVLVRLNEGQGTASKLLSDPALYEQSKKAVQNIEIASEKGVALLEKVEKGQGTIGQLMTDKELYVRANQAVKELNALAGKLNDQNGTLARLADPTLYKRLDNLTSRGEQLLAKVEGSQGTAGKLINQDELYQRADKLLTEVESLIEDVKKNPTKYFKFSVF